MSPLLVLGGGALLLLLMSKSSGPAASPSKAATQPAGPAPPQPPQPAPAQPAPVPKPTQPSLGTTPAPKPALAAGQTIFDFVYPDGDRQEFTDPLPAATADKWRASLIQQAEAQAKDIVMKGKGKDDGYYWLEERKGSQHQGATVWSGGPYSYAQLSLASVAKPVTTAAKTAADAAKWLGGLF